MNSNLVAPNQPIIEDGEVHYVIQFISTHLSRKDRMRLQVALECPPDSLR